MLLSHALEALLWVGTPSALQLVPPAANSTSLGLGAGPLWDPRGQVPRLPVFRVDIGWDVGTADGLDFGFLQAGVHAASFSSKF